MAAKPISMSIVKQIFRLRSQGEALLKIARITGVSKNTVKKYLRIAEARKLSSEQILYLPDHEAEGLFAAEPVNSTRYADLEDLFPHFEKELGRTGVTRWVLWGEYRGKHPGGYGYSQFCEHLHAWLKTGKSVMHFEHEPGDKLYIDFAGKKLSYTDRKTGEIHAVEVYLSVLGYSQKTYAEAVKSQKKEDFIAATQNALLYYGGVPKVLVPDNLKSAVTKADKYEADLNQSFMDFANHYQTAILPARSLKPRDKALVEKHVNIVYSRIYAPLRDEVFFSLEALNDAIFELTEKHNNTDFQQEKISRNQKFEHEKSCLSPLARERFEIKQYKLITVLQNSHVQLRENKHYYSVPYRYIGKKVKLIYSASSVAVYFEHERIALHSRDLREFGYSTQKEHLPSAHQFVADWNPEKFITWAAGISPEVEAYIRNILSQKVYPEQAYRSCVGILSFAKKEGKDRLISAVKRADSYGAYSYKVIKNILGEKLDTLTEIDPAEQASIRFHENIRGKEYYEL